jgi:hypothetical protein
VIAALFVERGGVYYGLPDVDPWDEERDARQYSGPWPVVAHPPCTAWCRLAGLVEARWGHKKGEDGGCFDSALESVRRFGGVLEHPAHSDAFKAFSLPIPQRGGGWSRGLCGGWSCYVEQGRYGHGARKGTWLYSFGVPLQALRFGWSKDNGGKAVVSNCGNRIPLDGSRVRLIKKEAARTPLEFRDALLSIARSAVR